MVDKSKKRKKGTISEDDISNLLQRYTVDTVLALLQEVAQLDGGDKIDWNVMVENTATGISCPREYQFLWRHLAYGQTLADQFDIASDPVDDDSDLEYEQEPVPAVSREASMEAAACVKVLIASGYPNDSNLPNNSTIEAPLTINIPNMKAFAAQSENSLLTSAMQGTNISIPVSVQKQPISSGTSGEKRPITEPSGLNFPPRRKRRSWSSEEDMKLTAAVQKYGLKCWANIARGDFENDRKAAELSQRWGSLQKKQGSSSVATSSQPSEAKLANRAAYIALDMPIGDSLKSASNAGMKSHHQLQKTSAPLQNNQLGTVGPPKSQVPAKRLSVNPIPSPDPMVKAAAIATGARIGTSADVSSLFLAARTQNVVHIKTGANSVMKSSAANIGSQLPSNVHFIRNGLAKAPISATKPNVSRPVEAQQAQVRSLNSAAPPAQCNSVGNAVPLPKTAENATVSTSENEINKRVKNEQAVIAPVEQILEDRSASLGNQLEKVERPQTSCLTNEEIRPKDANNGNMSDLPVKKISEIKCAKEEVRGNFDPNGRQEVLISTSVNGNGKVKAAAGDGVK